MLLHEWIEANSRAVASTYPQFEAVEPPPGSGSILAWTGTIRPFPDNRDLGYILDDLEKESDVLVGIGGQLLHYFSCQRQHSDPSFMYRLSRMDSSFKLKVLSFQPPQEPRVICLAPDISRRTFRSHPHLFGEDALCPYCPSEGLLEWGKHTMTRFLDYTSIWLAKHLVWERTGGCREGVWLGKGFPHEPSQLLRLVGRNQPCPCGKGEKYKRCCRPKHELACLNPAITSFRPNTTSLK